MTIRHRLLFLELSHILHIYETEITYDVLYARYGLYVLYVLMLPYFRGTLEVLSCVALMVVGRGCCKASPALELKYAQISLACTPE